MHGDGSHKSFGGDFVRRDLISGLKACPRSIHGIDQCSHPEPVLLDVRPQLHARTRGVAYAMIDVHKLFELTNLRFRNTDVCGKVVPTSAFAHDKPLKPPIDEHAGIVRM